MSLEEEIVVASDEGGHPDLCLDAKRRRPRRSGERFRVPPRIVEEGTPKPELRQSTRDFLAKLEEFNLCEKKFEAGNSELTAIFSLGLGSMPEEGASHMSER